ncbi:CBL-interacting serine/threonine-protein kinase 16 [Choanephora cucurbitarum]|uniref:CBL-interacting serine/threonine-protein kinase 16 n=1 Tax=Choanephora cucurbitarum TaxID=101091 RepID=A0A1C7N3Y2_9FUNG|nr:CBL-interacting serine/threonine-protein kinase 16 [Choanephora cucurbitarum]
MNTPKKTHSRRSSIGLGIVTKSNSLFKEHSSPFSKNNRFFDTVVSSPIRPPPSFQHEISRSSPHSHESSSRNIPTFADRIRAIVLNNRKSAASQPKARRTKTSSLDISSNRPTIRIERDIDDTSASSDDDNDEGLLQQEKYSMTNEDEDKSTLLNVRFPEEQIVPLPSPSQPSTAKAETFARHDILTPDMNCTTAQSPCFHQIKSSPESLSSIGSETAPNKRLTSVSSASSTPLSANSSIPVICLSPTFSLSQKNVIPSLQDEPTLGDMDDTGISREQMYTPPSSTIGNDDRDVLGKRIWKFRIKQLLGVGAFSRVFLAENLEEGNKVAVKMIHKDSMYHNPRIKSSIEREVGVLKLLNHESIVQLQATMETEKHLCIVLEYVEGGELFDFVQHMHSGIHRVGIQSSIDELLIKKLSLEVIQITSWLHSHNIVHRDLKLENILVYFDTKTGEPHIKITDFGLARVVDPTQPVITTRCGSEEYAAPEIVQGLGYDGRLTDTWSVGIILYALLVGYLPFSYNPAKSEKVSHLFHRIILAQVKWPVNDHISSEAKQVVLQMLVRQPEKRTRLDQIRLLPWFGSLSS